MSTAAETAAAGAVWDIQSFQDLDWGDYQKHITATLNAYAIAGTDRGEIRSMMNNEWRDVRDVSPPIW